MAFIFIFIYMRFNSLAEVGGKSSIIIMTDILEKEHNNCHTSNTFIIKLQYHWNVEKEDENRATLSKADTNIRPLRLDWYRWFGRTIQQFDSPK